MRLRRVAELAPDSAIDSNPDWRAHRDATAHLELATLEDLSWANGYAFGTPTRFGNVSSQLKQFLDTTASLWLAGELANKPATGFTSSHDLHGGQEATLTALYHVMYHWGSIVVPTGWVDYDIIHAAGGNPYGVSHSEVYDNGPPSKEVRAAARFQGGRLAHIAAALGRLASA